MNKNTPNNLLYKNTYRIPSARKINHDYSGGAYFVTICTKNRESFFGQIQETMHLSNIGQYAEDQICNITSHYPYATIPLWVVMPNHLHLIVLIDNKKISYERRKTTNMDTNDDNGKGNMQTINNMQGWLSVVIGGLKRAITKFANDNEIIFAWQSRFHDHIIRNYDEMNKIANYIETNIANWNMDCFHT